VEVPTADRVIRELFDADPTAELRFARHAVGKFRQNRDEDVRSARRRLYGYLARRGFAAATIATLISEQENDDVVEVDPDT
jgi:SOS response regulatory protein OraA/RecX